MGIPLMIMELGLGQKMQAGSNIVFRSINKRLAGIGFASAFASFLITVYYNVLLAHALIFFCYGFSSPMPWAGWKKDFKQVCDPVNTSRAEEFYNMYVLRYYDDNCKDFDELDPTSLSLPSFFATMAIWIICFICVARGIKNIGYVVWAFVPLPFIFLLMIIINNATLEGAQAGVNKYMTGEGFQTFFEAADDYVSQGLGD